MVRQFFGDWSDVRPMDLTIENVSRGDEPEDFLSLSAAVDDLAQSRQSSSRRVLPAMQSELAAKAASINTFATDIGDATESYGGVPGGNAVTMRWRLAADEALVATIRPPKPCAYWDVQLGNIWYESWDYRHFLSGIVHTQATLNADGSATIVLSERDPGTTNWIPAYLRSPRGTSGGSLAADRRTAATARLPRGEDR